MEYEGLAPVIPDVWPTPPPVRAFDHFREVLQTISEDNIKGHSSELPSGNTRPLLSAFRNFSLNARKRSGPLSDFFKPGTSGSSTDIGLRLIRQSAYGGWDIFQLKDTETRHVLEAIQAVRIGINDWICSIG
jgi:hypothetical protein